MVCSGHVCPSTDPLESGVEFRCPSDDYTDIDRSKVEEQAKIIQISIEEGVLVVPFDLDGYASFEAIDRMRRAVDAFLIDENCRRKFLFGPTSFVECTIKPLRYQRAASAFSLDFRPVQSELTQDGNEVLPFLRARSRKHAGSIPPFIDAVQLTQVGRNKMFGGHPQ
jgi:hypothetical protein